MVAVWAFGGKPESTISSNSRCACFGFPWRAARLSSRAKVSSSGLIDPARMSRWICSARCHC
jgi:hypothetical protein